MQRNRKGSNGRDVDRKDGPKLRPEGTATMPLPKKIYVRSEEKACEKYAFQNRLTYAKTPLRPGEPNVCDHNCAADQEAYHHAQREGVRTRPLPRSIALRQRHWFTHGLVQIVVQVRERHASTSSLNACISALRMGASATVAPATSPTSRTFLTMLERRGTTNPLLIICAMTAASAPAFTRSSGFSPAGLMGSPARSFPQARMKTAGQEGGVGGLHVGLKTD